MPTRILPRGRVAPVVPLVLGLACSPPSGAEREPMADDVYDNPYVGQGPSLSCPMTLGESLEDLGLVAMPITAEEARLAAQSAAFPERVVWSRVPEGWDLTEAMTWTVDVLDEPVQVSQKLPRRLSDTGETVLNQPACEAGAAWFVPVEVSVTLEKGLVFTAPAGIRVFGTGEEPDDLRIAAYVTPPMELSEQQLAAAEEVRFFDESGVVEGYVSGPTHAPSLSVVGYSDHAAVTLWRTDQADTVPCGGAVPCNGVL